MRLRKRRDGQDQKTRFGQSLAGPMSQSQKRRGRWRKWLYRRARRCARVGPIRETPAGRQGSRHADKSNAPARGPCTRAERTAKHENPDDRDSQRNRKRQPGGIPSGLPRGWIFVDVGAAQRAHSRSRFRLAGLREIGGAESRRNPSGINHKPRPPVGLVRGQTDQSKERDND